MTYFTENDDLIRQKFSSNAYELLIKIGEGGFGAVYKAKQLTTGQIVAIKFLSISHECDAEKKQRYIDRFHRETELGSRLQHPNIVRLLDKVHDGDLLYAVFEYVDGITLKEAISESSALSAIETAEVMSQVLEALSHAHEQGVIHRDIKPANIMLVKSGLKTHAKVLDFGIGTLVNEARQLDYKSITLTQETLGTPSYSAPEQLRGEPPTVKTDLYVWGLVFIECLTGKPAITGTSLAAIFHKQLSPANVPIPAAIIGHPIAMLLRRVLQKKAYDRSAEAATLYEELKHINFSNLVGKIGEHRTNENVSEQETSCDETVIYTQSKQLTGITERKQITVLSLSLSAFSIMASAVDQEVVDALHRDQKTQCVDLAIRYGAYHVGTLGDSLLFYFGYPAASDNDIRLCARTALDIVSNLKKRNALLKETHGITLSLRIGMHTGLVTCYSDAEPEGDTPNIAIQLARKAEEGQILCSETCRRMLENYSEFYPVSLLALGVDKKESMTYSLLAERQVEAFGFLRGQSKFHGFFGRDSELAYLVNLVNQSDFSVCKLNHIHGEAGIGKSRLIFELRTKVLHLRQHIGQCLPEHKNNALYPVLNIIRYRFALDGLPSEQAHDILRETLFINKQDFDNEDSMLSIGLVILCHWLNIPLADVSDLERVAPQQQKQLLFDVILQLFQNTASAEQQSLFIFEDLHWADQTTLEFIQFFTNQLTPQILVLSTSRKPLPSDFEESTFNSLKINKLSNEDTAAFIGALFDENTVSEQILNVLISRTDGVPLFIEELVDMLKQKHLIHHLNGRVEFSRQDSLASLPSSLRDSLQQKLDGLMYAKETAQLAATLGREFEYDLLVAVSKYSESQLQNDLNELIESEIIFQQRKVSGDSYIFKHALVRDAAYESQPNSLVIESHQHIVNVLETSRQDIVKTTPLIYIDHLFEAGQGIKAIEQSTAIGTDLSVQGNYIYSMNMIEHSLANLFRVPTERKTQLQSDLLLTYSMLLMTTKGFGSDDYKDNIKNINDLPLEELDNERQSSIYFSLMINHAVLSQLGWGLDKLSDLDKLVHIPEHFKALIHFANALIYHSIADFVRAGEEYRKGQVCYELVESQNASQCIENYRRHLPYDLLSALHSHYALALLEQDKSNVALAQIEIEKAEIATARANDPHSQAFFYFHKAQYYYYLSDFASMKIWATKSKDIATQNNIVTWKSISTFLLGWIQVNQEGNIVGLELMNQGYIEWSEAGAISHRGWMQALLAQSYYRIGDDVKGELAVTKSLDFLSEYGEKRYAFDILSIAEIHQIIIK